MLAGFNQLLESAELCSERQLCMRVCVYRLVCVHINLLHILCCHRKVDTCICISTCWLSSFGTTYLSPLAL